MAITVLVDALLDKLFRDIQKERSKEKCQYHPVVVLVVPWLGDETSVHYSGL